MVLEQPFSSEHPCDEGNKKGPKKLSEIGVDPPG